MALFRLEPPPPPTTVKPSSSEILESEPPPEKVIVNKLQTGAQFLCRHCSSLTLAFDNFHKRTKFGQSLGRVLMPIVLISLIA